MPITIGLNFNHADSSACIFIDNQLKGAIEEERINRVKHWAGIPIESIKFCLKQNNLEFSDVENITINTNPKSNIYPKIVYFLRNYLIGNKKIEILKRLKSKVNLKKDLQGYFNTKLSKNFKIHYIDHHISHIASAFYASGFSDSIGLSIDGFGDFCSLMVAECNEKKIKPIHKIYFPNSLGLLYEAFTQFIDFKKYGEEYKMMGMSSLGKPIYYKKIKDNLFDDFDNLNLNLKYFNHHKNNYSYNFLGQPNQSIIFNEKIHKLFDGERNLMNFKEDIASSIQNIFEDILVKILRNLSQKKLSKNLVYAGGCALNSLANKKIFDNNLFEKVYIPYAPGDGGGSIGSSLYFLSSLNQKFNKTNLQNPYLGPKFENNNIKSAIKKLKIEQKYNIKYFNNKSELNYEVAKLLLQNNVIGYFNGKMEFGARALGNRSILANPCSDKMKDIINIKIKKRENFRPFAPAILDNHKNQWFDNNRSNPFMSSVEEILPEKRSFIPAVTHFDGTGRVQTVSKEMNIEFYNLIEEFYKLSNVPILLNTSFNENEPIVMKPEEAINCFERTKMDNLIIENFLISRKHS